MNASVEILITQASIGSKTAEIGYHLPTATIAERINPFGDRLRAGKFLEDEEADLPAVAKPLPKTVDVPLCLDSVNPSALAAALAVYNGRALVNSVTDCP